MPASLSSVVSARLSSIQRKVAPGGRPRGGSSQSASPRGGGSPPGRSYSFPVLSARLARARARVVRVSGAKARRPA